MEQKKENKKYVYVVGGIGDLQMTGYYIYTSLKKLQDTIKLIDEDYATLKQLGKLTIWNSGGDGLYQIEKTEINKYQQSIYTNIF